jgi:ATP-dependent helicase HrpA
MAFELEFPENLPVSAKRLEIIEALEQHQVVIVCGETGSGKTTQLPKIALSMGRGKCHASAGQRGKLIGHTQPRRIAASSVAKRIAAELQTPLGEVVGYKVRFQDKLSPSASVKLMTDGILLAETQSDPLLQAYDTIIIDEAHERSLNIDFLLGYLRQILPRRPDLKIIVTSATIDADRFAQHFASRQGPAPIIMVSGRMFPVEQRYRPFEESRDFGVNHAIADAVDELWRDMHHAGDILVFLPGEREIREAADHLRKHLSQHPALRSAEVLPLFARLSQAEQDRVFAPHGALRIVLATNVAETSLTVPGIRFVIDVGTARMKRYSFRNKVEQLLIEPISQAAANQRAGRCGRVADGVCIRLYEKSDLEARPRFTEPEILRSSLAGVILRMKSLRLGSIEDFPLIDRPTGRAIADGYQLLAELGAVDEANTLTPMGGTLARLPLDPRIGRMLIEAHQRQALNEMLIITSALSVQDVRDRPLDLQAQADQAHAKFDDEKSEFVGLITLWNWIITARGGKETGTHHVTQRQYEQLLRQNFINGRRVREWKDTHSQLHTLALEQHWRINTLPASYDQLHLAMLSGLLGNVGVKLETDSAQGDYLGARGIKFFPHPGAHLKKKPGRWIVASELVETSRLYGRGIAHIDPAWLEQVGAHVLNKQLLEPHWEKKAADVIALERATLYGLVVYSGRRVQYSKVDPQGAREIFIREALVYDQWEAPFAFISANRSLIRQIEELEHKARRQDVLVDDALIFAFYDQFIPHDVCSGITFERWYREAVRQQPKLLFLTRESLMRHDAAGITRNLFPPTIRLGGVDCKATYLHAPGDARDGVTVVVPLFVLNQVNEERCEWLVPGMLKDKIQALLKTLHQRPRSRLVPLPDTAERMADELSQAERFGQGSLLDALLKLVRTATGLDVVKTDFKVDMLVPHHFMHFVLQDEHGRQLGHGRSIAALKAQWSREARGAFQALAALKLSPLPRADDNTLTELPDIAAAKASTTKTASPASSQLTQRYTDWSFGELPELLELEKKGQIVIGFPALIDVTDSVVVEVFDEPELAARQHRMGLRRLFALQLKEALKYLEKNIPELQKMGMLYTQSIPGSTADALRASMVALALDRAFLMEPLPTDANSFQRRLDEGRSRLNLIGNEIARLTLVILQDYACALRKIKDSKQATLAVQDAQQQLQRLLGKQFLLDIPWERLQHLPRYCKAVVMRLDKWRTDPARDDVRMAELRPLEQRYWRLVTERKGVVDERATEFRWMLEELRVSLFAQELKTPQPVSVKRLEKAWLQLAQ